MALDLVLGRIYITNKREKSIDVTFALFLLRVFHHVHAYVYFTL